MRVVIFLILSIFPLVVHAEGSLQSLSRCISDSTTGGERKDFARWIYVAISKHPELETLSNVPKDEADKARKNTANIFIDLLRERCHSEAQSAYSEHGQKVYRVTGEVLGRLAMQEVMRDPKVNSYLRTMGTTAASMLEGKALFSTEETTK